MEEKTEVPGNQFCMSHKFSFFPKVFPVRCSKSADEGKKNPTPQP